MSFGPGDRVCVGQHVFQVDVAARRLVSLTGDVVELSDEDASIAPGVKVRFSGGDARPGFVLAFTAPAGTLIRLVRAEDGR